MGKCVDKGYIPYAEINICDGCIHKDVCGDKDYLTENRCSGKVSGDIEHITELMKAEGQGLLVRLPCKVGDTVYYIGRGRIDDVQIESIHCWISGIWKISGRHGTGRFYTGYEFYFEDFGKTVFLTRKEAEKALQEANRNAG